MYRLRLDALVADPGTLNEVRERVFRAVETAVLDVVEYADHTTPEVTAEKPEAVTA